MNKGLSDIIFNTYFYKDFTYQDLSDALRENEINISAEEIEIEYHYRTINVVF